MKEYEFPYPNEDRGYKLFPEALENDSCILFHGTLKNKLQSIIKDGFKSFPPLESVSYAKCSSYSLGHICQNNPNERQEDSVVIAVKFDSLNIKGIANNPSDIHVYKEEIQPKIIGYCIVPKSYRHI